MAKASTSLSRGRLKQRILSKGEELSELLGISGDEAVVLLRHWSQREIEELWFEDGGEAKVRAKAGLGPAGMTALEAGATGMRCGLCLEEEDVVVTHAAGCGAVGHEACEGCWREYVRSKICEGRACGRMRCFGLKCGVPLGVGLVERLVGESEGDRQRFWKFYVEEEVEESKGKLACCPSEDCEWILERGKYGVEEVECGGCGERFCARCLKTAHQPADCEQVAKWEEKNVSESENVKWILAHTKPCPKCSKPIEKNQGCNHIFCNRDAGGCGVHFCWMCGKEWDRHGSGDPYSCNIYQASEEMKNREKVRQENKNELNRYLFFFERYNGHMKARTLAGKQLGQVEKKMERVHKHWEASVLDMHFFQDALKQIIKCRKVLMYTYVYGFFLDENSPMKQLFEHLQKNLEEKTDKLHELVEKDFDREVLDLPEDFFRINQDPIIAFSQIENLPDPTVNGGKEKVRSQLLLFRSKVNNLISVVDKFTSAVINDLSQDALLLSAHSTPARDSR